MAKQTLEWRNGRTPQVLTEEFKRKAQEPIKEKFLKELQETAGQAHGWPVASGLSRDTFEWSGDILRGTVYANRVNLHYDNILEQLWGSFDFDDTIDEVARRL